MNFQQLRSLNWDEIKSGIPGDPLERYAQTDWTKAELDQFIRMYWPRESEAGGIYHKEAIELLEVALRHEPKFILEIGTFHGTSTRLFGAYAKSQDARVLSIDGQVMDGTRDKIRMLGMDTHVQLKEAWVPWLPNLDIPDPIDLLFIDGDHSFIGVLVDYHYFNFFVPQGGIIAFHDCNLPEVQQAIVHINNRDAMVKIAEVDRLWIYQKTTNRSEVYFELLDREDTHEHLSQLGRRL